MSAKRKKPQKKRPKVVMKPHIFKACLQKRFTATKRVMKAWIEYRRQLNWQKDRQFQDLVKIGKSFGDRKLLNTIHKKACKDGTKTKNAVLKLIMAMKKLHLLKLDQATSYWVPSKKDTFHYNYLRCLKPAQLA